MKRIRLNTTSLLRKINSLDEPKDNNSFFNSNNNSYYFDNIINSKYKPLSNKNSSKIKIFNFKEKRNNLINISNIKENNQNNSSLGDSKTKDLFNNSKQSDKRNNNLRNLFIRHEKYLINRNKTFNESYSLKNIFNNKNSFFKDKEQNIKKNYKLRELKERLNNNIKKHMIFNKKIFERYNLLFKAGMKTKFKTYIKNIDKAYEEYAMNNNNLYKKDYELNKSDNGSSFKINNYYNCFSVFKSTFNYQDNFLTPKEFLNKYFDKKEISLMKSSPKYFGLNKAPFKFEEQIYSPNLKERIQIEEGEMDIKSYKQSQIIVQKNNKENNKYILEEKQNNENKRKIYIKLLKLNKQKILNKDLKRPKIKIEPFFFHYERDIDPDEGTVAFFEKRFDGYLNKKMKELKLKMKNNNDNINKYEIRRNKFLNKIIKRKQCKNLCI